MCGFHPSLAVAPTQSAAGASLLVLALALLLPAPVSAQGLDELTTSQSRSRLLTYEEVYGPGTVLDDNPEHYFYDWLRLSADVFASLGEHRLWIPSVWEVKYDPATVIGGDTIRVYLFARTQRDPVRLLQSLGFGWEWNATLEAYVVWDWVGASIGYDFGADLSGFGEPPMDTGAVTHSDDLDLPLPSVPYVSGWYLEAGSRLHTGQLAGTVSVTGGTVDACLGTLPDPLTIAWNNATHSNCLDITVDNTLGLGDEVQIQILDPYYYVHTAVPLALGLNLAEHDVGSLSFPPIPTSPLTPEGADVGFSIPVVGSALDLAARDVAMSHDWTDLLPGTDPTVWGSVQNLSDSVDLADSFDIYLEYRAPTDSAWTALASETVTGLDARRRHAITTTLDTAAIGPGDWELRLRVPEQSGEASADNNERQLSFTILDIPADVTVVRDPVDYESVEQAPRPGRGDEPFDLTATVANDEESTLPTGAFDVLFERHDPATGVWVSLGTGSAPDLEPGDEADVTITVEPPSDPADRLAGGGYLVRVTADSGDVVDEGSEYNNTGFGDFSLLDIGIEARVASDGMFFGGTPWPPEVDTEVTAVMLVQNEGVEALTDVQVDFWRVGEAADLPIDSVTVSTIPFGADGSFAVTFVPEEVDPDGAEGEWVIRAETAPIAGEIDPTDNVAYGRIQVNPASIGDIEGSVRDRETHALLADAVVSLPDVPASATSSASPLPDGLQPDHNYRLLDVPTGLWPVEVTLEGYADATAEVVVSAGHTRVMNIEMAALPPADLTGDVVTDPEDPAPGSTPQMWVELHNIGGIAVPPGVTIVIAIRLNGSLITGLEYEGGVDAGGSVLIPVPGIVGDGIPLPELVDSIVEVIVDDQDAVAEANEGNNQSSVIVTNPKPEVTIDSVTPNPVAWGSPVELSGTATDPGGLILYLEWRSDRDGLVARSLNATVTDLSPGTHTLTLRAWDERGEWAEAAVEGVEVLDSQAPRPRVVSGPGPEVTAPGAVGFRWAAVDDVSADPHLQFSWQLEGLEEEPGPWSAAGEASWGELAAGDYVFAVWARDEAGNESEPARWDFGVVDSAGDDDDSAGDDDDSTDDDDDDADDDDVADDDDDDDGAGDDDTDGGAPPDCACAAAAPSGAGAGGLALLLLAGLGRRRRGGPARRR